MSEIFKVMEWDWFKVQLRLRALEYSAEKISYQFEFDDKNQIVMANIFNDYTATLLKEGPLDGEEPIDYYRDWVDIAKIHIEESLSSVPNFAEKFDLDDDCIYRVMNSYGMGSSVVCEFKHGQIQWPDK